MGKGLVQKFILALAFATTAATFSGKAQAAPVIQNFSCTQGIQQILWDGGAMYIDCIGQPNRFAAFTSSPCTGLSGNSMDNIKLWEALATSAMISGKLLILSYATPASCQGSVGAVTTVTLSR